MPTHLIAHLDGPIAPVIGALVLMPWVSAIPQMLVALLLSGHAFASRPAWRRSKEDLVRALRRPVTSAGVGLIVLAIVATGAWWLAGAPEVSTSTSDVDLSETWSTFGGSPARCGMQPASVPAEVSGNVRWQFRDADAVARMPFASSPAVTASRVVIGCDNFRLYCLRLDDHGALAWQFDAAWPVFSSPAIWNGRVYFGEGLHENIDAKFYCLDLATGRKLWEIQTTSHTESSPTIVDGRVYFGAGADGITCADALTGEVVWRFGHPEVKPLGRPHVDGCPLVVNGRVYFGSGYGFQGVYCLDARTGDELWKREMPAPVWGAPSAAEGRLYVAIGNGNFVASDETPYGEVRCLDLEDGRNVWRCTAPTDGVLTSVAVAEGCAVFGSRDGHVYAVDAAGGALRWKFPADVPVLSSPAVAGGCVFFGDDSGKFRCLSLADGAERWSFDSSVDLSMLRSDPRIQSSPAVVGANVIFGASNGNVYCLGGGTDAAPVVARSRHGSRLMHGADVVVTGFLRKAAAMLDGAGPAVIALALLVQVLLVPTSFLRRAGIVRLAAGILSATLLTVGILALQSSAAFDRARFLWMSDLASIDNAVIVRSLPVVGIRLSVLSLGLFVATWLFLVMPVKRETRWDASRQVGFVLLALSVTWLTDRWPAGVLLFVTTMLLLGVLRTVCLRQKNAQKHVPPRHQET